MKTNTITPPRKRGEILGLVWFASHFFFALKTVFLNNFTLLANQFLILKSMQVLKIFPNLKKKTAGRCFLVLFSFLYVLQSNVSWDKLSENRNVLRRQTHSNVLNINVSENSKPTRHSSETTALLPVKWKCSRIIKANFIASRTSTKLSPGS